MSEGAIRGEIPLHRGQRDRRLRAAWVALGIALAPAIASANGRYPRAERLVVDPTNQDRLLLAATYGVLSSPDRGAHWYHICEAEFAGDPAYAQDPLLDLVAGGAALVDVQSFIGRSPDGCSWSPVIGTAGATSPTFDDFAVDRATRTTVVAVETVRTDAGLVIDLQRSQDAGVTWSKIGTPLPLAQVMTIDLDPTDATHVVATGLSSTGAGVFLSSPDSGETWSATPIPNTDDNAFPYIAAIDPRDPDKIYVRTDSWILPADAPELQANDALLYSANGGATWTMVVQQSAKLFGFALSPDGTQVAAGYGDPVESGFDVDPTATGIYVASTSDFQFAQVFSGAVSCLTWTSDGTYACLQQSASGSLTELGIFDSGLASPDAGTPRALMTLADVTGPPPCCAATDAVCVWTDVCSTLGPGACRDGAAPSLACTDAGGPDATVAEAGTLGGKDAGSASSSAASQGGSSGGSSGGAESSRAGGCSCRSAGGGTSGGEVGAVGLVALLAAGHRRARRVPGHEGGHGPRPSASDEG
jgi:MYXO-CTERM domain-containing protein